MRREAVVKLRLVAKDGTETFEDVDTACLCCCLCYDYKTMFHGRRSDIVMIELFVAIDTASNPCHVGLRLWTRTRR
jgi:hypothetical protein